jgi:hypothetical protein
VWRQRKETLEMVEGGWGRPGLSGTCGLWSQMWALQHSEVSASCSWQGKIPTWTLMGSSW